MNLTVLEAKIVAMVITGVGSFIIGVFPACFTNRGGERKLLLSALLCFGAGVLLATSMLHMLPETRESLANYSELVFCGGFLLLYMVDEIVHLIWGKVIDQPPELHLHEFGPGHKNSRTHSNRNSNTSVVHEFGHSHACTKKLSHSRGDTCTAPSSIAAPHLAPSAPHDIEENCEPNLKSNIDYLQRRGHQYYGSIPDVRSSASDVPAPCCDEEGTLLCHGAHAEPCSNTNSGLAGLLMALTLHSILEGLAIGLQNETPKVLILVAAVASHKLVVGFCLGVELAATAGSFIRHLLAIVVFAGGSAAGIGIAMMIIQIKENWIVNILLPVLQGIAGGSLLYVTVSEVLPRERARWHRTTRRVAGITQFLSVLFGFSFMYILSKYTEAAHAASINHEKP
ncbi:zinc transporter ZIP1 [Athalia rosae]|uniref:zinc transporter ZIP1 n=1 Tax=Athalia rosae TaxID=37344 RepID=UPI0020338949|nr:zinc transporter ZIP1 [Athalia rosae]